MEALLNLVWVLLAIAGFATLLLHSRRSEGSFSRVRFGHLVAVFLIVLSLFPAVSASDDVLRYQFLYGQGAAGLHDDSADAHPNSDTIVVNLVRLFDSWEHSTTAAFALLAFLLLVVRFIPSSVSFARNRAFFCRSGRAPPVCA